MNIILFGPPGVGKTTLIGILKSRGARAIDLEDVYPCSIRFQLPSMLNGVVFGAADLNPARKYPNAIKVLLDADQEDYNKRRASRDAQQPGKSQQKQHLISDWKKGASYNKVIFTQTGHLDEVATEIARLLDSVKEMRGSRNTNT